MGAKGIYTSTEFSYDVLLHHSTLWKSCSTPPYTKNDTKNNSLQMTLIFDPYVILIGHGKRFHPR